MISPIKFREEPKKKVGGPCAAALAFAPRGHAHFADPATTGHRAALFWLVGKFLLLRNAEEAVCYEVPLKGK